MNTEQIKYANQLLKHAYSAHPSFAFDAFSLSKSWGYENVKIAEAILVAEDLIRIIDLHHKIKITEKGLKVYIDGGFEKYYKRQKRTLLKQFTENFSSTHINNLFQIVLAIFAIVGFSKSCFSESELKSMKKKSDSLQVLNDSLRDKLLKQKKLPIEQKKLLKTDKM